MQSLETASSMMDYLRADHGQSLQTINIGYGGDYGTSGQLLVEFKPIGNMDDQRLLFNCAPMQGAQVQYVTQKYTTTSETQTPDEHTLYIEDLDRAKDYEQPNEKKPCQCHVCGKRYANVKALKKHQIVHPEVVFDWQCRICNKTFPYKITMSRHLKLHAGEKLFKCENCSKRFETRYALIQHVKLHKEDVPFRCKMCSKPFLKAAEFNRHLRTHTGEKPFHCQICDKSFTTKASFLKHSEKKHNLVAAF